MNNKMHLKKIKKRKIFRFKYLLVIFIIYISFSLSFFVFMKNSSLINNQNFMKGLMNYVSVSEIYDYKTANIVNETIKFFTNIDLKKPYTLLNPVFSYSGNEYIDIKHNDDYSNLEELKKISSYIEDPYPVDINKPRIYLYNTHQLENYNNHNLDIYNITPNVLMASYILKEKLNKMGISTIVEDTNLSEFLNINGWNHSSSYKATRLLLLDKINKYDTLEYFIDIHRDSVGSDVTTVSINNQKYARVLFVLGLENKNYNKNLEVITRLNNLIKEKYPSLTRGIYKKEGPGVDGVYNQDINKNCILIEIGGVDNTIEEVFRTIEILSEVIKEWV